MPGPQPRFETDPDLITRVCALITTAAYPPTLAFEAEGISRQVWHNYRTRAEDESHYDFARRSQPAARRDL